MLTSCTIELDLIIYELFIKKQPFLPHPQNTEAINQHKRQSVSHFQGTMNIDWKRERVLLLRFLNSYREVQ